MEATDVRVHQSRALLQQHGRLGGVEYVAGSVNGSRAIRERLSAAVTTRQLKRAAAATTRTSLEYGHVASAESSSAIGNSGCLSGLLSIKGGGGGGGEVETCTGSAIQDQPLDFSKKKRPGSRASNQDEDDELENKALWKKSQGRPTYLQVALESELNPRSTFVDDRRAASPFELSKPLLDHSPFLDGRGFGNALLNDLMLSTSVQGSQKLAAVRPFKNYDSVHEYYSQKPPFVSPSEMSPMDNGYSTDSYLDFRRQILNLQQSFAGSGCKRSGGDVVTEYLPQSSVQHGNEHLVHNHGHHHHHHHHHNHHQRNGHHLHYGERSSSDPLEVNQSRASSNSSCSSMSPVAVRHRSPVGVGSGGDGGGSLATSGAVSSNRANRSTSSTSSAEGMAGTRRRAGRSLPDELKDDAYWERRRKNNEAAKRSRDARRAKEDEIAIRAAFLEQENLKLRVEVSSLKSETSKLRCLLYNS